MLRVGTSQRINFAEHLRYLDIIIHKKPSSALKVYFAKITIKENSASAQLTALSVGKYLFR